MTLHATDPRLAPTLDVRALIDFFGGYVSLSHWLAAAGYETREKTIKKWRDRNRIPIDKVLQIYAAAEVWGVPFDLKTFIRGL